MTKIVYRYDEETGCFLGEDVAFESPLEEGVFLIPAYCTEIEPLEPKDGFNIKFNDSAWEYEEIPKEPELEPTLDELKAAKLIEVNAWTESKITGGFVSEATGELIIYDSDVETQITVSRMRANCENQRFAELFPEGMECRGRRSADAAKEVFMLQPAEIICLDEDLGIHIRKCKIDGWTKQAAVKAAQSKEELDKIILD